MTVKFVTTVNLVLTMNVTAAAVGVVMAAEAIKSSGMRVSPK